jgi:hypothetical protein
VAEYKIEPDYIIPDAWVVCGPQPHQRQHAVKLTVDGAGVEWAEFSCGASGASSRKRQANPVSRAVSEMTIVDRRDLIAGRPVCKQGWCQARYRDFIEHSDEYRVRRAEEDARIAEQMPAARRRLLEIEKELAQ